MEERLKEVLLSLGFREAEIRLEGAGAGKIAGVVVSTRFRGKSQEDRQNELWDNLRQKLKKADLARVVALLTMTPEEIAA